MKIRVVYSPRALGQTASQSFENHLVTLTRPLILYFTPMFTQKVVKTYINRQSKMHTNVIQL